MKSLALLLTLTLRSTICYAADTTTPPVRSMHVHGSAIIEKQADVASFSFTVLGVGADLFEAVDNASTETSKIIDALVALGVKKSDINTMRFISGENYGDKAFLSSSRDYKAHLVTSVRIDSLDVLVTSIATILKFDTKSFSDITFSYSDVPALRRDARKEAAAAAKQKALDMAEMLEFRLGGILDVIVDGYKPHHSNTGGFGAEYGNAIGGIVNTVVRKESLRQDLSGNGFSPQTISVKCEVAVEYEIKSH